MIELLRATAPVGAPKTVGRFMEGPLRLSGTLIRRLKTAGGIRLNGEVVRTDHPLAPGDELVLSLPPAPASGVRPEPVPVAIAHEDADLVVVDKPPGLVVHPTRGATHGTLANGLAWAFRERGVRAGIHPVHRIDRQTSGLVLFAKHPLAHQRLDQQLRANKLARRYMALVWGQPAEAGRVVAPIARDGLHPVARAVDADGQAAATSFTVLRRFPAPDVSLVALALETGRTHQIRVHMAHLGHPLVGDDLYAPARPAWLARQALHAETLAFEHPRSGAPCAFRAPLPPDMAGLLARLERGEQL